MLLLWFVANTVLWPFNIIVGGLRLNLNVPVLIGAGIFWLWRRGRITRSTAKVLIVLIGFVVCSMVVAIVSPCNDNLLKSAVTAPILLFLAFIGWEAGATAKPSDWLHLPRAATYSLMIALAGFVVEIAMPSRFPLQADYRAHWVLSGIFQEPSNVAFALIPCAAVLLASNRRKWRRRGALTLAGLAIISHSSTLIALTGALLIYRLLIKGISRQTVWLGLAITLGIGLAGAASYQNFLQPTVERIAGVVAYGDTENLSSLAYVQGWEDAWANFSRTHGLGLGFNMMGCHPLPDVAAREILALRGIHELNADDGTFQFSKIVSETGIFGILFYVAIIRWWLLLEKRIRTLTDDTERCVAATQSVMIFCFITSSFVRGGSYFSGAILLWLVAVSGASTARRQRVSARPTKRKLQALVTNHDIPAS
jgi:hypothetical protein